MVIEDNHGATFKEFTVRGGTTIKNNGGSDFSNFNINPEPYPMYAGVGVEPRRGSLCHRSAVTHGERK